MKYLALGLLVLLTGCFTTLGARKEKPEKPKEFVEAVEKPDTVQAVQTRPVYVPMKDPPLASLLSFLIPGAGQIYAGRANKGVGIFLGSTAASALAIKFAIDGVDTDCGYGTYGTCRVETEMGGAWLMIGTAGVFWLYGVLTAADDARAYNAAHGFAVGPTVIESRPGLRIAWRP